MFFVDARGDYYEGDRVSVDDVSVSQRPGPNYAWQAGAWVALVVVPASVSRRQGRLALAQAGLLTALEAWIAAQPVTLQIWYQDTSAFERGNAYVLQAATALNWSRTQVDGLFVLAGGL